VKKHEYPKTQILKH